jgi:hypothetical protein
MPEEAQRWKYDRLSKGFLPDKDGYYVLQWDYAALRAYATHLREENERLRKDAGRIKFLHECTQTDQDGYEWGVFRVKWQEGKPHSVLATLSDSSDLDRFIELYKQLQAEYGSQFTDSISGTKNAAHGGGGE